MILDHYGRDVLFVPVHADEHECRLSIVLTRRVGPNSDATGLREKALDGGSTKEPASMVIRSGALAMIAYEPQCIVERDVVPFVSCEGHENTLACGVRGSSTTLPAVQRRAQQCVNIARTNKSH